MEAATKKIRDALEAVESSKLRDDRQAATRRVFRSVHELRCAVREVRDEAVLREGAAQATAWDALEATLSAKQLVVSEALCGLLCDAVVALFAFGDAGGMLYAAFRGLYELCGDALGTSRLGVGRQSRSVGSRAAACAALGALCAAQGNRLNAQLLGDARARLAKHAAKAQDPAIRCAAFCALGAVTHVCGLDVVLGTNASGGKLSGADAVKLSRVCLTEKSGEVRCASARCLAMVSAAAARVAGEASEALAGALAAEAASSRTKVDDMGKGAGDSKKDAAPSASKKEKEGKEDKGKRSTNGGGAEDAKQKAAHDFEGALNLLDAVADVAFRGLADECLEARQHYAHAAGVALAAHAAVASETRNRVSVQSARADEDAETPKGAAPADAAKAVSALASVGSSSRLDVLRRTLSVASNSSGQHRAVGVLQQLFANSPDGLPTLAGAVRFASSAIVRSRQQRDRAGIAGAARCTACLLSASFEKICLYTHSKLTDLVLACLASVSAATTANSDDADDVLAASRCGVGRALRDGVLGKAPERLQREVLDVLLKLAAVKGEGQLGEHAAQVVLCEAAGVVLALGSASAPHADDVASVALAFSAHASLGCRVEAARLGGAVASALGCKAANLARWSLRKAMAEHHALVDVAVSSDVQHFPEESSKKAASVRRKMHALHGAALLTTVVLRRGFSKRSGPNPTISDHNDGDHGDDERVLSKALYDEALAVAEGLVTRQFDASLAEGRAAAMVTCVRAGWSLIGALASSSSPERAQSAKTKRLLYIWERSIAAAAEHVFDSLDAMYELACVESCVSSVLALARTGALDNPQSIRDVSRLLQSALAVLRGRLGARWRQRSSADKGDLPRSSSAERRLKKGAATSNSSFGRRLKLAAAAILETYATLGPTSIGSADVFGWCVDVFRDFGAAAASSDAESPTLTFALLPGDAVVVASSTYAVSAYDAEGRSRRRGNCEDAQLGVAHAGGGLGCGDDVLLAAEAFGASYSEKSGGGGAASDAELGSLAVALAEASDALERETTLVDGRCAKIDARLVDAVIRALARLIGDRPPQTQRDCLDVLAASLQAALQPPKTGMGLLVSEDERRRRERRHSAAAHNASLALERCIDSLPIDLRERGAPFTDAPRDALARALSSSAAHTRRSAANALAALVVRLPAASAKASAAKALLDAATRVDAAKTCADSARRAGAALAVAALAQRGISVNDNAVWAVDEIRKPLCGAGMLSGGSSTTAVGRAWLLHALASAFEAALPQLLPQTAKPGATRQMVAEVLDALETQLVAPSNFGLASGVSGPSDALDVNDGDWDGGDVNSFGVDVATLIARAVARCVITLAPAVASLRPGSDAPLLLRYAGLARALLVRRSQRGDAYCAAAFATSCGALGKSLVHETSVEPNGPTSPHPPEASTVAASLTDALEFLFDGSHLHDGPIQVSGPSNAVGLLRGLCPLGLGHSAACAEASLRALQFLAETVCKTPGKMTATQELVLATAKFASLAALNDARPLELHHDVLQGLAISFGRTDATVALLAKTTLKTLVKLDSGTNAPRLQTAWLLFAPAVCAHQRRSFPRDESLVDALLQGLERSTLEDSLKNDAVDDEDEEDEAPKREKVARRVEVGSAASRLQALDAAKAKLLCGLHYVTAARSRTKIAVLECAETALDCIQAADDVRHFDLAKARSALDSSVEAALASRRGSRQVQILDFACLHLDELVSFACSMATSSVGDEIPVICLRAPGAAFACALVEAFGDAVDPDIAADDPLLAQYTSQLASALRAAAAFDQTTPRVTRLARRLMAACVSRSLALSDLVQVRRFIKLAVAPHLLVASAAKGACRPFTDDRFAPHVNLAAHLEQLALLAQLVLLGDGEDATGLKKVKNDLLALQKPVREDATNALKYLWLPDGATVSKKAPVPEKAMGAESKRAVLGALAELDGAIINEWRRHWVAALGDAARLAQGWPCYSQLALRRGALYDRTVEVLRCVNAYDSYAPLYAAAAASVLSGGDDDEADVLACVCLCGALCGGQSADAPTWLAGLQHVVARSSLAFSAKRCAETFDAVEPLVAAGHAGAICALVAAALAKHATEALPDDALEAMARCVVAALRLEAPAVANAAFDAAARLCEACAGKNVRGLDALLHLALAAVSAAVFAAFGADSDGMLRKCAFLRAALKAADGSADGAAPQTGEFARRAVSALPGLASAATDASAAAAVLDVWVDAVVGCADAARLVSAAAPDLARFVLARGAKAVSPLLPPLAKAFAPEVSRALVQALAPPLVLLSQRTRDAEAATHIASLLLVACVTGYEEAAAAALLATLLGVALAPLLLRPETAGGVSDALVKVARAMPQVFRGAITAVPPDVKAAVEGGMRAAMARTTQAAAVPKRGGFGAPGAPAAIRAPGLKIDMAKFG
ncbi:hypothetical protein M885DRAFT_588754 [Pelagophyceae sp. CCMP2097]|nr:hypothetical protein M885DRAFT_588754 [Pelagophyceae sp. CCMP2097]